jgi:hypothetical protein
MVVSSTGTTGRSWSIQKRSGFAPNHGRRVNSDRKSTTIIVDYKSFFEGIPVFALGTSLSASQLSLTIHNFHPIVLHLRDDYHKGKDPVPETKGIEEGSAKRNIERKNSPYVNP